MQILVYRQEGNLGPYSLDGLSAQLASGTVQPDDLAWHDGMSQWEPVATLLKSPRSSSLPPLPTTATQFQNALQRPEISKARHQTFYHQAATGSAWILLFPFVVQFFEAPALRASVTVNDPHGAAWIRLFFSGIIGLSMLTGIILGILALFGIPKYGTKGILVKSLLGILVPIILILLSVPVFLHAQERAAHLHAMQETNSASGY